MPQKKNKFDFASEDIKLKYLNEIIGFFHDERDEDIGLVAAEQILDFFVEKLGEEIYKKGVTDCQNLLKERMSDLDVELGLLAE